MGTQLVSKNFDTICGHSRLRQAEDFFFLIALLSDAGSLRAISFVLYAYGGIVNSTFCWQRWYINTHIDICMYSHMYPYQKHGLFL